MKRESIVVRAFDAIEDAVSMCVLIAIVGMAILMHENWMH